MAISNPMAAAALLSDIRPGPRRITLTYDYADHQPLPGPPPWLVGLGIDQTMARRRR